MANIFNSAIEECDEALKALEAAEEEDA